jgi:hypothetical protein
MWISHTATRLDVWARYWYEWSAMNSSMFFSFDLFAFDIIRWMKTLRKRGLIKSERELMLLVADMVSFLSLD